MAQYPSVAGLNSIYLINSNVCARIAGILLIDGNRFFPLKNVGRGLAATSCNYGKNAP